MHDWHLLGVMKASDGIYSHTGASTRRAVESISISISAGVSSLHVQEHGTDDMITTRRV